MPLKEMQDIMRSRGEVWEKYEMAYNGAPLEPNGFEDRETGLKWVRIAGRPLDRLLNLLIKGYRGLVRVNVGDADDIERKVFMGFKQEGLYQASRAEHTAAFKKRDASREAACNEHGTNWHNGNNSNGWRDYDNAPGTNGHHGSNTSWTDIGRCANCYWHFFYGDGYWYWCDSKGNWVDGDGYWRDGNGNWHNRKGQC